MSVCRKRHAFTVAVLGLLFGRVCYVAFTYRVASFSQDLHARHRAPAPAGLPADTSDRSCEFESDMDYGRGSRESDVVSTKEECCEQCWARQGCVGAAFSEQRCWYKLPIDLRNPRASLGSVACILPGARGKAALTGRPTGLPTTSVMSPGLVSTNLSRHHERVVTKAHKQQSDHRPTGLRLLMIGDSLTRYQYISLAFFLRYGRWINPGGSQKETEMVWLVQDEGHQYADRRTNRKLEPLETCDCFHTGHRHKPMWLPTVTRNRYFYDPSKDNAVTYMQALAQRVPLRGRWNASGALSHKSCFTRPRSFAWQWEDWGDAIRNYATNLNPRPKHVVLNSGIWGALDEATMDSLARAKNDTGMKLIWKTTTFPRPKSKQALSDKVLQADALMCEKLGACLNVSWTRHVAAELYQATYNTKKKKLYKDNVHFKEPVYRRMNEQMLEQFRALPKGYQRLE